MPYLLSCDIHTHTMFSAHAYSTIEENVYWAAERGLQVLGSADHLSSMVTACPNDLRSYQFFINQDIWPRIWSGVLVLRGAEADIVSLDGSLFGEDTPVTLDIAGDSYSRQHSLFDLVTRNLDYLVASVHNPQIAEGATLAQATEMYINALEHPRCSCWATRVARACRSISTRCCWRLRPSTRSSRSTTIVLSMVPMPSIGPYAARSPSAAPSWAWALACRPMPTLAWPLASSITQRKMLDEIQFPAGFD